jgi:hypothetical protein
VYWARIYRRDESYSTHKLGAIGSNLAAVSLFFDKPFEVPAPELSERARAFVLGEAALYLSLYGRLAEALPARRANLRMREELADWRNAAISAGNLGESELLLGEVAAAVGSAVRAVEHADQSGDDPQKMIGRTQRGAAEHAAGRRDEAQALFADAERRQQERQPDYPLLYSFRGYVYCDLLLDRGELPAVRERATQTRRWVTPHRFRRDIALDELTLGRAELGLALSGRGAADHADACRAARAARDHLDHAAAGLRAIDSNHDLPHSLLARAGLRCAFGGWDGAARDLDQVEEIATPGPMLVYLCDRALEWARLALAQCEAFATLNGIVDGSPPKPEPPSAEERERLLGEATQQIAIAVDYIKTCGYHRRDEELAELQAVLRGERSFASLPPRV